MGAPAPKVRIFPILDGHLISSLPFLSQSADLIYSCPLASRVAYRVAYRRRRLEREEKREMGAPAPEVRLATQLLSHPVPWG